MVKHVVKYVLMISPSFLDQFECSWACLKAMDRNCNILSLRNFRTPSGTSAHLCFQPTSAELSNMEDSETLANVGWSINHISHC